MKQRRKFDIYENKGDITLIHIVGFDDTIKGSTIIDSSMVEQAQQYKWNINSNGYVIAGDRMYLHRFLTSCPKGKQVDHINGNRLDNKLSNLRVCTQTENNRNAKAKRGKYKGVYKHTQYNKFVAQITHNGKINHIGVFDTEKEAAAAYNEKALELHGEYAYLNDI